MNKNYDESQKKFTKWIITGFIYSIILLLVIANTAYTKPNYYVILLASYWATFFLVFVGSVLLILKKHKVTMILWMIGGILSLPLGVLIIVGSNKIRKSLKNNINH